MKILKKWLLRALVVALLCGLIGGTYAKYVKDQTMGGTVTIQVSLGTIELWEHKADLNNDGTYTLDTTQEVLNNTYVLLPGLDIPKDPFVRITDKSPIPVYIFVEVTSALSGSALSFEVDVYDEINNRDGNWIEVAGATPKHSGKVYVYTGGTDKALAVTGNISGIYILKDNQVIVGQKLNSKETTDLGLTFYASMYQVASGDSQYTVGTQAHAKSVYDSNTTP